MSNFILDKSMYYYYEMLTGREKDLYKMFLNALLNMNEAVAITEPFTSEQVSKVSRYVINDRPDIFWYKGEHTITTRNGVIIRVTFHYVYSERQKEDIISGIQNSYFFRDLNAKMSYAKSDFEKALLLYEYIIKNTEYEKAAVGSVGTYYEYAYGMDGVILKHRAVCAGYAKAFQYFANKHNLSCTLVTGQTKRSRHAWNLINLYGSCYYIDATWGDPVFSNVQNKDPDYISYNYFCITTAALMESHRPILDDYMPLCTATKYNYYEYFGMVESYYSIESVTKHIVNAARSGKKEAVVKYSTNTAYQTAVARLFQSSEVFDALKMASRYVGSIGTAKVRYNLDDDAKIISIKF